MKPNLLISLILCLFTVQNLLALSYYCTSIGSICLVQETEDGRIRQIGLTTGQNRLLQIFLASLSKEHPLVQMSEDFDLVLKSSLCKKCKHNSTKP